MIKNIYKICEAILAQREKAELVDKVGGITTALAPSDKLGYLFRIYYVNEVEVKKEYIKDEQYQASGDGTAFSPYDSWTEGTEVHLGEWWKTFDGYLWEAIKDGVPSSSTDAEYWDIPDGAIGE